MTWLLKSKALRLAEKTADDLAAFKQQVAAAPVLEKMLREFAGDWKRTAQALEKANIASDVVQKFKSWSMQEQNGKAGPEKRLVTARRVATVALAALAVIPLAAGVVALQDRLQRLRIKADILRLKAKLGTMDLRDELEEKQSEFRQRLSKLRHRAAQAGEELASDWEKFRKEMSSAYQHLGKAFNRN